jgi:hypothetical protein
MTNERTRKHTVGVLIVGARRNSISRCRWPIQQSDRAGLAVQSRRVGFSSRMDVVRSHLRRPSPHPFQYGLVKIAVKVRVVR